MSPFVPQLKEAVKTGFYIGIDFLLLLIREEWPGEVYFSSHIRIALPSVFCYTYR
ncbi:hypothetical protein AGMMS49940_23660 [Spirochaetia bacterium]|nr:hypothetical protein AGMMS49940_23660 [Spirochaetia bacterium]